MRAITKPRSLCSTPRLADGGTVADLLPTSIRRRVEKLAVPPASFEGEPLRALLRHIVGGDYAGDATVALRLDPAQGRTGSGSLLLFSLLYGRTLAEVAEQSSLGDGRHFILDRLPSLESSGHRALTRGGRGRGRGSVDPGSSRALGRRGGVTAAAVPLVSRGPRWLRGVRCADPGYRSPGGPKATADLESWAAELARSAHRGGCRRLSDTRRCRALLGNGARSAPSPGRRGLSKGSTPSASIEYVEAWSRAPLRAREELVPGNSPLPELDAFARYGHTRSCRRRVALLATHPLRMRWFAAHLEPARGGSHRGARRAFRAES